MERSACHVIYVNRNVAQDRLVSVVGVDGPLPKDSTPEWTLDQARQDIQPVLDAFGDVHVCATGRACISKLLELQDETMMDMRPTLILLDIPHDERIPKPTGVFRVPSPLSDPHRASAEIHCPAEEVYGLNLLQKIITESHLRNVSKLVVPVPIISFAQPTGDKPMTDGTVEPFTAPLGTLAANRQLVRRCLDLGAVDVIISPLNSKCITTLEICAYKAHRDASREQQTLLEPFAYLREAMVSGLMNGICRLTNDEEQISGAHITVSPERQSAIAEAVGRWHFCAHSFSDDELLVAALIMFKHAFAMPELGQWRIPTDQLISFLVACRVAYNDFVPFHNFRHVVDVLQATFNFLIHVGALPAYSLGGAPAPSPTARSTIASLLSPFEALTLLITAIGHDVGHPGVNNGFLATLNAPLAQLYNDRSVLESFHCAAYSQILRRYWNSAFEDRKMRNLMISSILATDMGLHFDYMKKLDTIKEKLKAGNGIEGWTEREVDEGRALACALIIKCADISNVARHHDAALQWMHVLAEEFSRQASMESELEIKSSLLAPPKKDIKSMSSAQLGFMSFFAVPLFQGVAEIMPAMKYAVDEIAVNKALFEQKAKASETDLTETAAGEDTSSSVTTKGSSAEKGDFAAKTDKAVAAGVPDEMKNAIPGNPSANNDVQRRDDIEISPPPIPEADHAGSSFNIANSTKSASGTTSSFDAVRELADSDPFQCRDVDGKAPASRKQRCSEATDGSASGGLTGDGASQATSATTGKMPISPSTKGTSIVSRDSLERPSHVPGVSVSPPSSSGSPATVKRDGTRTDEGSTSTSSLSQADGKALKKKPSRFRMKDFHFFRRHKEANEPLPTDMTR